MILIFADDRSVTAVDDIGEANTECEMIDVENGVFTFLDEHAAVLHPTLTKSTKRTLLGSSASHDAFSLVVTVERRPELLQAIIDGKVSVEPGPRIHTREELIRELSERPERA